MTERNPNRVRIKAEPLLLVLGELLMLMPYLSYPFLSGLYSWDLHLKMKSQKPLRLNWGFFWGAGASFEAVAPFVFSVGFLDSAPPYFDVQIFCFCHSGFIILTNFSQGL